MTLTIHFIGLHFKKLKNCIIYRKIKQYARFSTDNAKKFTTIRKPLILNHNYDKK